MLHCSECECLAAFLSRTSLLLSTVRQIKQKEKEIRLLILGLDNAGKSTVLAKLCGDPIDTIVPTTGFNIQTILHKLGYSLNLWDVGGQKSIRAYWRNYFESTDGLIWVVDSTDRLRLQDCRTELIQLLKEERLAGATLLILANKQDLPGALSADEIRRVLQLDSLPANRHWNIQMCSAVTGSGLVDGLDWIVQDIASRIFMLS
jgi:ADP-ribosylation factor-like protein 2